MQSFRTENNLPKPRPGLSTIRESCTLVTSPPPVHQKKSCPSEPDFNPCDTANPCSPFYLYNHDSPRASTEKARDNGHPVQLSLRDLESGDLSPTISLEKEANVAIAPCSRQQSRQMRLWPTGSRQRCMTRPKQRRFATFNALPKWKKITIKLCLAVVVIGAMIGIGVGIAISLHAQKNTQIVSS